MRRPKEIRLAVSIFIAIATALILPGLCLAGSLEPPLDAVDTSGNPVPTMKTLDQIPPTWSQKLQCDTAACPRFQLVLDGAGVLDKETGLVWEQSPTDVGDSVIWSSAVQGCSRLVRGGRLGWRLPTLQELASLVDRTQYDPALPSGHPFSNVRTDMPYWSATTSTTFDGNASSDARLADIYNGDCGGVSPKVGTFVRHVWCVRGGEGMDVQ